ncbi:MAG: ABC transporter ATP-binding protein [Rhizobium sp.]|nr:ABC transporter ATP-binding protein [Rhizobium sp.]
MTTVNNARLLPALEARDLTVGYRRNQHRPVTVLNGVNASLRSGELAYLLGPNGAGKSTLLRSLVGSQQVLSGQVMLDGKHLGEMSARLRAQRLSVVLTDKIDVGLMSVDTLVGLGRMPHSGWFSRETPEDRAAAQWALEASGAQGLAHRQVAELSDGERQRVMIARALAQKPSVLILDEPTAFLDLTRRVELTALLRRLVDETGLAVLMSTHDLELALRTADQIWLVHRDGRFETGCPEDLALSGSIAGAYAGDGISFDHEAGTFVVDSAGRGPHLRLEAQGTVLHWASRAVVRGGWLEAPFGVPTNAKLSVLGEPGTTVHWSMDASGQEFSGTGFSSLVAHLRTSRETHTPKA